MWYSILVFLCLAIGCCAQEPSTFESLQSGSDPALNTDPASTFWAAARPVYAEVDSKGNPSNEYRTEIRSRWTKENLYFLFTCPYKHLYVKTDPDTARETYGLWKWNVAEVFIGSDFNDIKRYKEFEVSPQNEWVDLDINLNSPHHEDGWLWNSGFQHETRNDVSSHTWYVVMNIPFASLGKPVVEPGNLFRVNFYRTDGPPTDTKEVMWRPTQSSTFHVPERFGVLKLVAH